MSSATESMQAPRSTPSTNAMWQRSWWIIVLCAISLLLWIGISWPAVQDDAFIHLRYAEHLLNQHLISYDGVHRTFGVSSLLYVSLLAGLRALTTSSLLPRAVSTFFHIVLFSGLTVGLLHRLRGARRLTRMLALLYLAVLAMPSAVRWLDDGMESSLVLCFIAVFVFTISAVSRRDRLTPAITVALGLLGLFGVLLRVEMLLLLAAGSFAMFASRRLLATGPESRSGRRVLLECAAPLIGGLLGAAFVYTTMHALLPDTAVAKAAGFPAWRGTADATVSVFASSMSFGMMSLVLWLLTLAAVWNRAGRLSLATLAANCVFPITLLLAVVRGQAVQGIRYFDWLLGFSLLWNLLELARLEVRGSSAPAESAPALGEQLLLWGGRAAAIVLLIALPIEATLFLHVFNDHKQGLAEFRSQHLDELHDLRLTAFDIGYIGYFTGAPVCDLAGLVDGRPFAKLTYGERSAHCASTKPAMVFGNMSQIDDFNSHLDLSQWSVCASYALNNLRKPDVHYLVAAPQYANEVCRATGQRPEPLAPMLPHPVSAGL